MSDWMDWLTTAVKWVVGGLLMAALMRWLALGQARRPVDVLRQTAAGSPPSA